MMAPSLWEFLQKEGEIFSKPISSVSDEQPKSLEEIIRRCSKSDSEYLSLSGMKLSAVPQTITSIKRLTYLDLSNNLLSILPPELGELSHLRFLIVSRNQLKDLPDELAKLTRLSGLILANNRIFTFPRTITKLIRLDHLDLSNNSLTELPADIGNLTQLSVLDVANNKLNSLPNSLRALRSLKRLSIEGNGPLGIPAEIASDTSASKNIYSDTEENAQRILDYYFTARSAPRPLNEARVIFVGFGGVGKTSLTERLIHDRFNSRMPMTDGISIANWSIPIEDTMVRVHVWDFGGQEIMHATHQFFLTHRSLYILVLNGRQGREDADAEYWLNLIASFGGDSPVIVVLNKIREYPFHVNRNALREKFPMVRDVVATDCADPSEGIQTLRAAIHREIDALQGLRDAFPAPWFAIKDQLSSMPENYLSFDRYRALCAAAGVKDYEDQNQLAEVLHRLGVALNYRDDARLHDLNVLNPRWVTEGVYKILNHPKVAEQKGELHISDVAAMLNPSSYPRERHIFLLELMRKFELCFRFPDEEDRYLIPQLLPKEQPDGASGFDQGTCLGFEYHYPTLLPEGLLPRFIVRTYVLSTDEPRWRSGVILRLGVHRALVVGDPVQRRVRVLISGPQADRSRLLEVIRSDLDLIHSGYKFKPEAMISVPGYPRAVVRYDDMVAFEAKGLREVPHVAEGEVIVLPVKAMLDGVDVRGARRAPDGKQSHEGKLQAFVSYSHKDDRLRAELETHLKLLQRIRALQLWTDRRISAGTEWKGQIDENLERADLILLLISADFMNSDYCWDIEMTRALERHDDGGGKVRVVPIIVREVNWRSAPFGKLQALPADGKVVDRGSGRATRDRVWAAVAKELEKILQEIADARR